MIVATRIDTKWDFMRKLSLFTFFLTIAGVLYLVRTTSRNTPSIPIPAPPQGPVERIISFCKHPIPMIVLGLDASDRRLVGVNPDAKISMQANVLSAYYPGIRNMSDKICSRGFSPNMEEILQIKPDLILHWDRFPEVIAQMQGFGFNVQGVHYDGSDRNDREMIRLVASAMGREAMADSLMHWRDSIMRQIKAVSDPIPAENKPKVIFFYNFETLRVGGEKCYENFCIDQTGGRNMGAGLGIDRCVNLEQILEWDPDVILLGGWMRTTSPGDIYQNPMLANLSAVRNRRVFKTPIWASNESVLLWEWVAEILHPDLYHFNLREDIQAIYAWQYRVSLTESDLDQVLFYPENMASSWYENFKNKH